MLIIFTNLLTSRVILTLLFFLDNNHITKTIANKIGCKDGANMQAMKAKRSWHNDEYLRISNILKNSNTWNQRERESLRQKEDIDFLHLN